MRLSLNRVIGLQADRRLAVVAVGDRLDEIQLIKLTDEQLDIIKKYLESQVSEPKECEVEVEKRAA